jgi:Holliday junction resolvasome RuvABC endonuclease subunit
MRHLHATGPPGELALQNQTPRHHLTETIMASTAPTLPAAKARALANPSVASCKATILALDLGTNTGWAVRPHAGPITSGTVSFRPSRYDGGGMRYLRFHGWLDQLVTDVDGLSAVHFEEVRRHAGTDAAHVYGGLLATLTAWCEQRSIAYQGVPVGTIKRFATGKGNADKAAMLAAMRARGFSPTDDNEADALAILLWAIETDGGVR